MSRLIIPWEFQTANKDLLRIYIYLDHGGDDCGDDGDGGDDCNGDDDDGDEFTHINTIIALS